MFAEIGEDCYIEPPLHANVVAVGNPCRVLREINDRDKEYYFKDRRIELDWETTKSTCQYYI